MITHLPHIPTLLAQGIGDLPWTTWGPVGALGFVMFYFYRQDRKDAERKYESLAMDFRRIVEENTKAITAMTELIRHSGMGGA